MYEYLYVCMHVHTYSLYIHTCIHTYIRMHMCIHAYMLQWQHCTILKFLCVWKGGGVVFGNGGINNLNSIILELWNVFHLGEIQFRLGEIYKKKSAKA